MYARTEHIGTAGAMITSAGFPLRFRSRSVFFIVAAYERPVCRCRRTHNNAYLLIRHRRRRRRHRHCCRRIWTRPQNVNTRNAAVFEKQPYGHRRRHRRKLSFYRYFFFLLLFVFVLKGEKTCHVCIHCNVEHVYAPGNGALVTASVFMDSTNLPIAQVNKPKETSFFFCWNSNRLPNAIRSKCADVVKNTNKITKVLIEGGNKRNRLYFQLISNLHVGSEIIDIFYCRVPLDVFTINNRTTYSTTLRALVFLPKSHQK